MDTQCAWAIAWPYGPAVTTYHSFTPTLRALVITSSASGVRLITFAARGDLHLPAGPRLRVRSCVCVSSVDADGGGRLLTAAASPPVTRSTPHAIVVSPARTHRRMPCTPSPARRPPLALCAAAQAALALGEKLGDTIDNPEGPFPRNIMGRVHVPRGPLP